MIVVPARPWRIITSDSPFDFNYQAMGISPAVCFDNELALGELSEVGFAEHYTLDVAKLAKQRQDVGVPTC